jgi:hypothetical protein
MQLPTMQGVPGAGAGPGSTSIGAGKEDPAVPAEAYPVAGSNRIDCETRATYPDTIAAECNFIVRNYTSRVSLTQHMPVFFLNAFEDYPSAGSAHSYRIAETVTGLSIGRWRAKPSHQHPGYETLSADWIQHAGGAATSP